MKKIFIDTSFLVAFYNKGDENHLKAREFIRNGNEHLYVITDYIFDEFLTVLLVRRNKALSVEAGVKLLTDRDIRLLRINADVFAKAWEIYRLFKDKQWSFTDCTSYVLMKNLSMDAGLSFDAHFLQFGCKILP